MKLSRHPARMILTLILVPMLFMLADTANAAGQGYRTIYRFQGSSDGWLPLGVPAADKNGNLYGVTGDGGAYKLGTVYKLTAPQTRGGKWTKTVLYNFASNEGGYPGSVVLGQDGNLYGHAFSRNIFELTPPTSRDGAWKYAYFTRSIRTMEGPLREVWSLTLQETYTARRSWVAILTVGTAPVAAPSLS